jgi:hypothetical protein
MRAGKTHEFWMVMLSTLAAVPVVVSVGFALSCGIVAW